MDLEACINLIEKPLGIMSMLEEECIVPKVRVENTRKTFSMIMNIIYFAISEKDPRRTIEHRVGVYSIKDYARLRPRAKKITLHTCVGSSVE